MDYRARQRKFRQNLADERLDGFAVNHPPNLHYLCGYTGSNGLLLFAGDRLMFFTDGRYTQQAREEVEGARIVIAKRPLLQEALQHLGRRKSVAIGFEADHVAVATAVEMRKLAGKKILWKPTSGLIMRQRLIKDADELRTIREAVNLGAGAYCQALKSLRPDVRESEVAGRLELAARQAGAQGMSFDTIVAAGKRSALPHGRASSELIPPFAGSWWSIQVLYCVAIVLT